MIFLFYIIIGLWSSSTVLGYLPEKNCGHGISVTKIIHKKSSIEDSNSTGYVIYPRAVLTVAHRVKDFSPEDFQIISSQPFLDGFVRDVSEIYVHPKYNSCNGSYDFAILTFNDPLPANYTPICLPSENLMNYIQANYNCSAWDYYYSRFYKISDGSKDECPTILSNSDDPEDIKNTNECLMKERGEINETIGDRSTMVYICKLLSENNDYREYYHMHTYYGGLCEKDQNDGYISYYGEDLVEKIHYWITYVTSILIEEDDQPLKLSLIIKP
ncbi:uncharacterized protein [Chelonus insularis]|uniref:uncharacterized protein n=1 Tax=Chelonus insularis TaxID=460826 RepID=UPI00158BF611|nr:uncharacterized protein LOC118069997 [Chelonus insularis]